MQAAISPRTLQVKGGIILYDATLGGKVHEHVFTPSYWRTRDALGEPLGGRGAAWRIQADGIDWVLREYRRGGLPGRFISDWYLYTGLEATRAWREWRLLAQLYDRGLPVPRPVAARVQRGALGYRAALITMTVPGESLAQRVAARRVKESDWRATGRCIRRFHDAGVWHADLNAHNILLHNVTGDEPQVHLIDFDRGRLRAQDTAWREANLARLRRSLAKIAPGEQHDVQAGWAALVAAYADGLHNAHPDSGQTHDD